MAYWKLKIDKQFADEIASGMKTFEIRDESDKIFQKGDSVEFLVNPVELHAAGESEAFFVTTEEHPINGRIYDITYVLHGWGLREGYCAFAIKERVNEEIVEIKAEDIAPLPPEIEIKEITDTLKRIVAKDIRKMCDERQICVGCMFNEEDTLEDKCMLRGIPGNWKI